MNDRFVLLEEMLKKDSKDCFLNYAYALELEKRDRLDEATEKLRSLIVSHPDYLPTYYQLGKMFEKQNNKVLAINTYERGLELARTQKNFKTMGEIEEALGMLE